MSIAGKIGCTAETYANGYASTSATPGSVRGSRQPRRRASRRSNATPSGWPRLVSNPRWGSKGDRDDNALDETINGLYKAKVIHCHASWKTQEAVELATLEWVSWFNHHRLLEPIGYVPTAEAEAHDYRSLNKQAVTG